MSDLQISNKRITRRARHNYNVPLRRAGLFTRLSSYVFKDTDHCARSFSVKRTWFIYTVFKTTQTNQILTE